MWNKHPSLLELLEEHGVWTTFGGFQRKNEGRKGAALHRLRSLQWMEAVAFVLQSVTGRNCAKR